MTKILRGPNGAEIIGTLEHISGVALLQSPITRLPDGSVNLEYEGETDIYWDEQRSVERPMENANGKIGLVFIDENGEEIEECDLIEVDDEEEVQP